MTAASDLPGIRRSPGRGRVILIIAAVALFVLVTSVRQIAEFWTDFLWFESVGLESVWSRTLFAKVGLGLFFVLLLFVALWLNLLIADRVSPMFPPLGPDDELLTRYHQIVDRRAGGLRITVALVFAVITGGNMASRWNDWLLFTNAVEVGRTDPQFGMDIGFYLFRLPFLTAVTSWLFTSLLIVILVTTVAHYLNGGIRLQSPLDRVTPQVKAHLSVLLALAALVRALDYYLQQYQVLFSSRGAVDGASYTEVHAQLPALRLLLFIALAAFVLFLVNIRRRGWALPAVAVGLWLFVQLVIGGAYPTVFQRFVVQPEESAKESLAIERNIEATRAAYGLDEVEEKEFTASNNVADGVRAINENPSITRNVQLLDPDRVLQTFNKKQSVQAPLQFNQVATDRYQMRAPDGTEELTQVVIANRDMSTALVPSRSWQSEKLNYTHGYGFALAAGNAVDQDGAPGFAVRSVPIESTEAIDLTDQRPDNYYFTQEAGTSPSASTLPDYSVIDTGSPEFDYVRREGTSEPVGDAAGGVPLDSLAKRAAFYLRFGDLDLLISQYIKDESRILYERDIRQRAMAAAPFLAFDSNPYPAVVDGRVVYILDAYTTADTYPNAQRYPNERLDSPALRLRSFNYVRNSVKVVIDSFSGSMKFYVVDDSDPVVRAYQLAFPELFSPRAEMSTSLWEHVRYPEDLFTVQTDVWGRYHISDTSEFYNRDDAWEPPPRPLDELPTSTAAGASQQPSPQPATQRGLQLDDRSKMKLDRMSPNYVLNQLPEDRAPNFMLMRSYQPFSEDDSKQMLTSFMVGRSDSADYGKLQMYRMTGPLEVQGAAYVATQMQNNEQVSQKVTLLDQRGTKVLFSDLILLPIDQSVMFVRSMYVVSNDTPLVQYVVLSWDSKVYIDTTLRAALARAFPQSNPQTWETPRAETQPGTQPGTTPGTTTTTTAPPGTGVPQTTAPAPGSDLAFVLGEASRLFNEARDAQRNNDTALWAQKLAEAEAKVRQAQDLVANDSTATTTTVPPATPATTAAPPASP
jgi:uncharacterized membrane protein (UPF0182 family)